MIKKNSQFTQYNKKENKLIMKINYRERPK